MRGLLAETAQEIINRPMDILRCFWPTTIFISTWTMLFLVVLPSETKSGGSSELDGAVIATVVVLLLILFAVTIAPGVIRWHRLLISNQATHWFPLVPRDRQCNIHCS